MSLQYDRLYVDGRCYGWSQAQGRVLEQGVMYLVCVHCLLEQEVVYSTFVLMLPRCLLEQGVVYFVCVHVDSLFA